MATHTINVTFSDDEYISLIKIKNGISWKEFILSLIKEEEVESGV